MRGPADLLLRNPTMMKKYMALVLCISSSLGYAYVPRNLCPYLLNVIIQNDTGTDCHLIQQTINQGNTRSTELPLTVLAMQKSPAYTFETEVGTPLPGFSEDIDVTLTYQCGDDKVVTFDSKKTVVKGFLYHAYSITGLVTSISNIDADYTATKGNCSGYPPNVDSITWMLR